MQRKSYSDQTGRFPVCSSKGNQYIMVLVDVDSNAILVEPLRNRTSGELCRAYQKLIDRLHECGSRPRMHILDNECSAEMKALLKKNDMQYQLVPPHNH